MEEGEEGEEEEEDEEEEEGEGGEEEEEVEEDEAGQKVKNLAAKPYLQIHQRIRLFIGMKFALLIF